MDFSNSKKKKSTEEILKEVKPVRKKLADSIPSTLTSKDSKRKKSTPEILEELETEQKEHSKDSLSSYTPPHISYAQRIFEWLQDFTNLIPLKRTEFDSHLVQRGAYGYTVLNGNYMVRDRYLHPWKARETDVHELIHTTDEYETRELTRWMLAVNRVLNYYSNIYGY